jgi:hypothetical protein
MKNSLSYCVFGQLRKFFQIGQELFRYDWEDFQDDKIMTGPESTQSSILSLSYHLENILNHAEKSRTNLKTFFNCPKTQENVHRKVKPSKADSSLALNQPQLLRRRKQRIVRASSDTIS